MSARPIAALGFSASSACADWSASMARSYCPASDLALEVYEGDVRVSTETYGDRGEVLYDMITGEPVFQSTLRPGLTFRGDLILQDGFRTGAFTAAQALAGSRVTYLFGRL